MKRYELRPGELSDQAFSIYSDSDMALWQSPDGVFYWALNSLDDPVPVGALEDIEALLTALSDE